VARLSDSRPWHAHYDYWVRPHLNYPRRPLTDILRIAAADVPDRPATAFLGTQLTFAEVKERADKFATALARMGVKQGDRVGVMLPNCPQYIIAVFGILRVGAIVVNVNPLYTPREVGVVAQDSGMRVLVVLDMLVPSAGNACEQMIVVSFKGGAQFDELIAGVDTPQLPRVHVDADDVAVLQYTGGTTGTPKGAMLTHYNIFSNVVQRSATSSSSRSFTSTDSRSD
jgi:long-chain acyl-CoA synthetase